MPVSKGKIGLYVEIEPEMRLELDRIAIQQSRPGNRITLRQVVVQAIEELIARNQEQGSGQADKAQAGDIDELDEHQHDG